MNNPLGQMNRETRSSTAKILEKMKRTEDGAAVQGREVRTGHHDKEQISDLNEIEAFPTMMHNIIRHRAQYRMW